MLSREALHDLLSVLRLVKMMGRTPQDDFFLWNKEVVC